MNPEGAYGDSVSPEDVAPSPVALAAAYAMATHQGDSRPVFLDPLASRIVGIHDGRIDAILPGGIDFRADQRMFVVFSQRYVDEAVLAAVADGVTQLVILDAGLQTLSYRRRYPDTLRMFEVDTAAAQRWKRGRLAMAGIDIPRALSYVRLDDRRRLADALAAGGFDPARSTMVVWMSSVMFRSAADIEATLAWLGGCTGGLELVVDYLLPPDALPGRSHQIVTAVAAEVARLGCPWRTFFTPAELTARLRAVGCTDVADVSWSELAARYAPAYSGTADPLGGRLAHAHS